MTNVNWSESHFRALLKYLPCPDVNRIIKERKDAQALAEKAEPIAKHGGDRTEQVDIIKLPTQGGASGDYLTRRIARDRPDILDRMKAGEYKSVRQAALEYVS